MPLRAARSPILSLFLVHSRSGFRFFLDFLPDAVVLGELLVAGGGKRLFGCWIDDHHEWHGIADLGGGFGEALTEAGGRVVGGIAGAEDQHVFLVVFECFECGSGSRLAHRAGGIHLAPHIDDQFLLRSRLGLGVIISGGRVGTARDFILFVSGSGERDGKRGYNEG